MASALVARRLPSRPPVVVLLLVLVVVLAWASRARGEEADSARLYGWRVTAFAPGADGAWERGEDAYGARFIVNGEPLLFGLQADGRLDVSAQAGTFALEDFSTWATSEGYVSLSRPFRLGAASSVGPALVAGGVAALEAAPYQFESTWGAGARLTHGRSWAYLLYGRHGASAVDPDRRRLILAVHLEVWRTALVADYVAGAFARVGLAFRIPAPGGGR